MKKLCFILIALLFAHEALRAQDWVQTNGPGGGFNQIVFNAKKDIFLSAGALMRSTDDGKNWTKITPVDAPQYVEWKVAIARNQDIYCIGAYYTGTANQVWKSSDNGESWIRTQLNPLNTSFFTAESILASPDGSTYVLGTPDSFGAHYTCYESLDTGKTWNTNPISINGKVISHEAGSTQSWVDSNGIIFVSDIYVSGVGSYLLIRSNDKGKTWQITFQNITSLACGKNGNIFISTKDTAYHSFDDGLTWKPIARGPVDAMPSGIGTFSSSPSGRIIFINSSYLTYSDDNGKNWMECANPWPFYVSPDIPNSIFSDPSNGFYFTNSDGALYSNQPCTSWEYMTLPAASVVSCLALSNDNVFGETASNIWQFRNMNWKFDTLTTGGFFVIDSSENILLIGSGVYQYNDSLKNWEFISFASFAGDIHGVVIHPNGSFFAATEDGITFSTDNGLHWDEMNNLFTGNRVTAIAL